MDYIQVCFIVFGASGDLAKRKTFPALFSLFCHGLLPPHCKIIGYARSQLSRDEFHARLKPFLKASSDESLISKFFSLIEYMNGEYDKSTDFQKLAVAMDNAEQQELHASTAHSNVRIFYLALPPSLFGKVAEMVKGNLYDSKMGSYNRIIVEKPFGHDLTSSLELSCLISSYFSENETYRIDHYLGKEMVKNCIALRFGNTFFQSLWNRNHISSVTISFKETIGVVGRGGYFDDVQSGGIIRDVMQNHLMQILSLVAMEQPTSLSAGHVRDEKVRVLRKIDPLSFERGDVVLGQYEGYREDPSVSSTSLTPTFAAAVLKINNERWEGVPFILKAGKALNEAKAEIRIQFKEVLCPLWPKESLAKNELVMRLQPNEAVYLKMMVKKPGLSSSECVSAASSNSSLSPLETCSKFPVLLTELDLSYSSRFKSCRIPDAYESLILDVLLDDQSNFVRDDELSASWAIFTPLLHEIIQKKIEPHLYKQGSRGPEVVDDWASGRGGYRRHGISYDWHQPKL